MSNDGPPANRGWFQKGRSGNPGGRPKRSAPTDASAFAVILDKTLTLTRHGVSREVSVEEALQQRTYQEALAGKRLAIREVLRWIVKREHWLARNRPERKPKVNFAGIGQDPENADEALLILGIAREDPDRTDPVFKRLQLQLEPWAVKAALRRRRGVKTLTAKEIAEIRRCSHDDGTLLIPEGDDR
jgi:hypothetical protein